MLFVVVVIVNGLSSTEDSSTCQIKTNRFCWSIVRLHWYIYVPINIGCVCEMYIYIYMTHNPNNELNTNKPVLMSIVMTLNVEKSS